MIGARTSPSIVTTPPLTGIRMVNVFRMGNTLMMPAIPPTGWKTTETAAMRDGRLRGVHAPDDLSVNQRRNAGDDMGHKCDELTPIIQGRNNSVAANTAKTFGTNVQRRLVDLRHRLKGADRPSNRPRGQA